MLATVERIIYQQDDGWTVMAIKPDKGSGTNATGYITSDIAVGSRVDITGEWTIHHQYGRQFKIATIVAMMPSTVRGIQKWLASGAIANVGTEMARRIVEHFGDETPYIIEHTPERIAEVEGIGQKRVAGLIEGLKGNQATRQLIEWLGQHGVSMGMISKLIKSFDSPEAALEACRDNPYTSLDKVQIPFKVVDDVALAGGIAIDDKRRLNAVAAHVIIGEMREGHCYVTEGALLKLMSDYLGFTLDMSFANANTLTIEKWGVYLRRVRNWESSVDGWLRDSVAERPIISADAGAADLIALAFKECMVEPSDKQFEAVEMAATHGVCVITGGPGTGKTTIVNALVKLAENCGKDVKLLAPTGRAQLRLGEVCGKSASTIHMALAVKGKEKWDEDIIIVDEMSMVDLELMNKLIGSIKNGGRLVMVGDYNQLPSIGAGNVLKDIIKSGIVPCVKLDTIFRQAQKSSIILNSHRIIVGRKLQGGGDCVLDYMAQFPDEPAKSYGERVEARIVQLVSDLLINDFNPFTEIQVLLPMYKHHPSIDAINNQLQDRLNPITQRKAWFKWGSVEFRQGDKVMHTKNNYKLGVYNGEIGVILDAQDKPKKILRVEYPGCRLCEYDAETIPELKLAYAVSIHKSQGSEYPCVVIGLSQSHFIMLQRNLLYTALTRAKKQCIVVGDSVAVEMAIKNNKQIHRNTKLLKGD